MFHSMLTAPLLDLGNNHGVGGYVDMSCLCCSFYPNNVKGAASDQGKFWAVYPDICGRDIKVCETRARMVTIPCL